MVGGFLGAGKTTTLGRLASRVREVDLIVNARVGTDPAILEAFVREAVLKAGEARGAQVDFRQTQSFRPGRPVPTHRYATGV
jgi:hypothetical protein